MIEQWFVKQSSKVTEAHNLLIYANNTNYIITGTAFRQNNSDFIVFTIYEKSTSYFKFSSKGSTNSFASIPIMINMKGY